MTIRKIAGTVMLNPSGTVSRVDSQQTITFNAALKYSVSPQTLWGVFGTESTFGANTNDSSAGAQGPMQFEPGTWAKYGNGHDVHSFIFAMPGAAHYLHDLGADTNPTSAATIAAVNAYNGNGGGSNANTSYFQSVLKYGAQFQGNSRSTGTTPSSVATGSGGSGSGGSGASPLDLISDLVTGDITGLAATLGLGLVEGVKDLMVGAWDYLGVPLWHRNQDAVWWYYTNVLLPEKGSTYKAYLTLPVNAAFWGLGYALLFTSPDAPKGQKLTAVPPHRARIARHVRRAQAAPARRSLVKPGDVKKHTPKKPKEVHSAVRVKQVGTMATSRTRSVRVTGTLNNGRPDNGDRDRITPERLATYYGANQTSSRERETTSSVPISDVREQIRKRAARAHETHTPRAKSHPNNSSGQRSRQGSRVPADTSTGNSRDKGSKT